MRDVNKNYKQFIGRVIQLSALKKKAYSYTLAFISFLIFLIYPFEKFLIVEESVNWPFIYNQGQTAGRKSAKVLFSVHFTNLRKSLKLP